jgi:two-component system NtrC family sensor kinase
VVTDQQGIPTALIIIVRDISERKQNELALSDAYNHLSELNTHLRHSRNVLQAIFDGLEDGLLLLDGSGTVQTVNRSLSALLGSTPQKLVGQSWATLYPRIAPDFPHDLALKPSENGRIRYQHTRYRNLDGGMRILNVQTIALNDPEQTLNHMIVHVADVTEYVQLQARFVENERFAANGRLAASVAHEINTPLQSIQTALGLIRVADEERRNTYLSHALEETRRVARIVRQLLDLYRPGSAVNGPVDMNGLIERILLLTNKRMKDQRITVEQSMDPDLPALSGRADELMQVLLNLMVNAIEAMPDGGVLGIATTMATPETPQDSNAHNVLSRPPVLVIRISDSGYGIPPHLQKRIFEPFVTTKPDGTGLGLSICNQIVQQHYGTIAVTSQPGSGSTFRVMLRLQLGNADGDGDEDDGEGGAEQTAHT